jgi:superfamily II DNA or RNA helicase
MIELRPYQRAAIDAVKDGIRRGLRSMLIVLPTGAGKTVVFSELPREIDARFVLILAHRDELIDQAVAKYQRSNPNAVVGKEANVFRADAACAVVAASVQTLQGDRLREFLARKGIPDLIVTDEAHHAVSPSYTAIYEAIGASATHVGVTATPNRGDKIGLDTVFEEIVYAISLPELIAQGYLVDLTGYVVHTTTTLTGISRTKGDFAQKQLAEAVNTEERNAQVVRAYHDLAGGKRAIVFGVDVAHSLDLCDGFRAAGYRAAHIDGKTPKDQRAQILAEFARGAVEVLCNCAVLTEGFDEPAIECVILARPTMSAGLYAQCIGRGTRLHPGKTSCIVIDMHDISRTKSCYALPALFGMPPNFDLAGRAALGAARKLAAIAPDCDLVGEVLLDAYSLDALEGCPPELRLAMLVQAIKEQNDLRYVPVELLRPRPVPQYVKDTATLNWFASDETRFCLRLPAEMITVEENQLGAWDVILAPSGLQPMHIGTHAGIAKAIAQAESWVRTQRPKDLPGVDLAAPWRAAPGTGAQRSRLKKLGVYTPRKHDLSRGEMSNMIEALSVLYHA